MSDLTPNKIPIFLDINDIPVAPTASSGGNISHFYQQYNLALDTLQTELNNLSSEIAVLNEQLNISSGNNSSTSEQLTNVENSISTINNELLNLQSQVNTNATQNSQSIQNNEANINTLLTHKDEVDNRLSSISGYLTSFQNQIDGLTNSLNNIVSRLSALENANSSGSASNSIVIDGFSAPQYEYPSVYTVTEEITIERIRIKNFIPGYEFYWGLVSGREFAGTFETTSDTIDYVFSTPKTVAVNEIIAIANEGTSQSNLYIEIMLV